MKIKNKGYNNLKIEFSTSVTSGTAFHEGTLADYQKLKALAAKGNTAELLITFSGTEMHVTGTLYTTYSGIAFDGIANGLYVVNGWISYDSTDAEVDETFTISTIPYPEES